MHADNIVMDDLGGPISEERSRSKLAKYKSMYDNFGYSRYCVEVHSGKFVGYVGICPREADENIGEHNEIGWRLNTVFWGKGYATEAARACLTEFHSTFPDKQVISYTTGENIRSQRIMERLNMQRVPEWDFSWVESDGTIVPLLVWSAIQPS